MPLYLQQSMNQQQKIQSAITVLNNANNHAISPARLYRNLIIVVKTLQQYNSNPQILPSQRFIPCCLFVVPQRICELINHDANQLLEEKPEKLANKLLLHLYLKSLITLLQQSDQEIKHIVIQGMSRSITMAAAYPPIIKRWIKVLLQMWATNNENLQIPLRCHLALSKYLSKCDTSMYMWSLRRMYVNYFENCKQVSWRNLQHINFMINSFCEIVKYNTDRAYYVLFGYLRSIALLIDKYHKSKRREKVQLISKLFSNQILNCFKLFTGIITRVQCEDLTALIYPLCQMFAAYERITQSPEYIPLKLHLLEFQLTIIETLGVYIPHSLELIEKLVKCSTFNRKISKKGEKVEANIELAFKVSKNELTQAQLINELFRSLMTKVFWFESLMCRAVYGAQIILKLNKVLKGHKFVFSEYQQQSQKNAVLIKSDSDTLYGMRASEKLSLVSWKKIKKFEQKLKETAFSGSERYYQLKSEEQQLLISKLAAEQEDNAQKEEEEEGEEIREDEDELNSGWQQASEGASEMDIKEIEEQDSQGEDEEIENVSYEGDPQDADEAVKEWSEEQWSSQNADQIA